MAPTEELKPDLTPPWQSVAKGLAEGFIRRGAALQGAAMANAMTPSMGGGRPQGIEDAYAAGAEGMINRLREEWDQDLTRKFQAQYMEDAKRKSAELDAQRDLSLRIVDIPFNENDIAQVQDPDGAPPVHEKGYETVNPVTGEVQYTKLGTPEAREHWKRVTQDYYNGKNSIVMEVMDAAAQYPNSSGVQGIAENIFNSMVRSVENEKNVQMMAKREQEMQESDERMAAEEEERRRRGILEEEKVGVLRGADPEGTEGVSDIRLLAREQAQSEQRAADADRVQQEGTMAAADAEANEGRRIAEEEYGATKAPDMSDQQAREFKKSHDLKQETIRKETAAAMAGKEQLRLNTTPETLRSMVAMSDEFAGAYKNVLRGAERERQTMVQNEVNKRLQLLPPTARPLQHDRVLLEVEASLEPINEADLEGRVIAKFIEAQVRNSPEWQAKWIDDSTYDSVEDFLGKMYPLMFKKYAKADPTKELSETNNVAYQERMAREKALSADPQSEPEEIPGKKFKHFQENWATPTPEQVQTALEIAESDEKWGGGLERISKVTAPIMHGLSGKKGQGHLWGTGTQGMYQTKLQKLPVAQYMRYTQILEGALIEKEKIKDQMVQEQINESTRIPDTAYESQMEELELRAERIQRAKDYMISNLPKKQRKAKEAEDRESKANAKENAKRIRKEIKKYLESQGITDHETDEIKQYIETTLNNPKVLKEMGIEE